MFAVRYFFLHPILFPLPSLYSLVVHVWVLCAASYTSTSASSPCLSYYLKLHCCSALSALLIIFAFHSPAARLFYFPFSHLQSLLYLFPHVRDFPLFQYPRQAIKLFYRCASGSSFISFYLLSYSLPLYLYAAPTLSLRPLNLSLFGLDFNN